MLNLMFSSSVTNFYGGLVSAVTLLDTYHTSTYNEDVEKSLSMIIILSDGVPTVGLTNPNQIKEKVKDAINGRYSLFTLGFGFYVDDTFLEKLAGQNQGIYRKIYIDLDTSLQLASFFDDVATPLAVNVAFNYLNVIDSNAVTQTEFPTYFGGSELVVAGKLPDSINYCSGGHDNYKAGHYYGSTCTGKCRGTFIDFRTPS